ncbi:MAG: hypothetical protein ACR2ME_09445 [Acidimicrobiia bacterium]
MKLRILLVAVLAALSACGTTAGSTTTTTSVTTTTTTVSEEATTTQGEVPLIRVEGGEKTKGLDTLSVQAGEHVVFDVIADVDDEVHVHGYDFHFAVTPGETTRVEFTAESTGIFEVELEEAVIHLVDIEVTP